MIFLGGQGVSLALVKMRMCGQEFYDPTHSVYLEFYIDKVLQNHTNLCTFLNDALYTGWINKESFIGTMMYKFTFRLSG